MKHHFNFDKLLMASRHLAKLSALTLFIVFTISCAKSSDPDVSELIPTDRPTIQGLYDVSYSASSSVFTIAGTCDKKSYGMQYSVDSGSTWTDLPDCTTGTYTFNVSVVYLINVIVRSKTKFAFTPTAVAHLRLVLPPTAPLLNFVTASSAPYSSLHEPRVAFTMPSTFTGTRTLGPGTFNMDLHATGIVYAQ